MVRYFVCCVVSDEFYTPRTATRQPCRVCCYNISYQYVAVLQTTPLIDRDLALAKKDCCDGGGGQVSLEILMVQCSV